VVMFGEIGGSQEEQVAELIRKGEFTKPLVAFIGGKAARSGTRFSHAGAIVEGNRGTWEGKVKALREAGAFVVEEFGDLPRVTKDVLTKKGIKITRKEKKMADEKWPTAITKIEPNRIFLRGYKLDDLMGRISYAQAVYLALRGELPSENVGKLIEAILVSSIDHGVTPPSALAALNVATTGAPLTAALAAGILSISEFHGGAIEQGMRLILSGLKRSQEKNVPIQEAALEIIGEYRAANMRLHGFGHRIHTDDPRTKKLFALAEELGLAKEGVGMAKALEGAFGKVTGKRLPVNVDGAIAALLVDLGFEPEFGNAFFIIARVPGLIAHILEEKARFAPMRVIDPKQYEYDGPEERAVGSKSR
jgi:citrate synthase